MLRRGSDPTVKLFGRPDGDAGEVPFEREPTPAAGEGAPAALGGWAAPASYLALDPELVAELTRSALGSATVAALREAEVAVGAMLASLALRGEDALLERLLPAVPELRLHRHAVGQLSPIAVHAVPALGPLLRSLSHCAAFTPGETWEAVAHDGRGEPMAIAAARRHELRWLQPPVPGSPSQAPWVDVSTPDPAPGSSLAEWAQRRSAAAAGSTAPAPALAALAAPTPPVPAPLPPVPAEPRSGRRRPATPSSSPVPAFPGPAAAAADVPAGTDAVVRGVTAAVEELLANAPLELELDAATLDQLRDTAALERLVDAVGHLEERMGQVDALSRQVTALTAAVEDLGDSTRSLLRHQWDNQPPQGFWVRVQKAEDEVRRSVEELTAEVRARLRPPR